MKQKHRFKEGEYIQGISGNIYLIKELTSIKLGSPAYLCVLFKSTNVIASYHEGSTMTCAD